MMMDVSVSQQSNSAEDTNQEENAEQEDQTSGFYEEPTPSCSAPTVELDTFVAEDVPATSAESEEGVCGLYNLGNTCYMNSVLQSLLHDLSLREYILYEIKEKRPNESILVEEVLELFKKYWSGRWSTLVPRKFKQQIGVIHSQFDGCGQHDGQEFLALFLASLHHDLKKLNELSSCDGRTSENNTSVVEEKSANRKRAGSTVDDSVPNNKRMDSSVISKQYLTLTSFIGKEKKTANVNVLSTDVECDEEVTTDHSNKFPQNVGHSDLDEYVADSVMNNQPRQRHKSTEGPNFVEQIKDLKLRQLQETNCKQTNVIADIKRHAGKEYFSVTDDTPVPDDSDCHSAKSELMGEHSKGLQLFVADTELSTTMLDGIVYPALSGELPNDIRDILSMKISEDSSISCLEVDSVTSKQFQKQDHEGSDKTYTKIFALKKSLVPIVKQDDDDADFEDNCSNNVASDGNLSKGDAPSGATSSESKELLISKVTNVFVDDNSNSISGEQLGSEIIETNEDLQDIASNIRGDICGGSPEPKRSVADDMWLNYVKANKSVIVDNFQGQLESTVVCCKCFHTSTTYEPFMYLSVPIPRALQRSFCVRIVPLNGKATDRHVYTMKEGRIEDLRQSLSKQLQEENITLDLSTFSFCEVKDYSILNVMESTSLLKTINTISRSLQVIEFLNEVAEESDIDNPGQSSWNSCCICLEEYSDPELLKHASESCSVLLCQACLQSSVQHYGLDNFSCPICHAICSPANDFVQLASTSQNRDVVVSVNFTYLSKSVRFLAPSRLLRIPTTLPASRLRQCVKKLLPESLDPSSPSILIFTTLDGASCSRCDVTAPCSGCVEVVPGDNDVTLHPGDNVTVRFLSDIDEDMILPPPVPMRNRPEGPVTLNKCLTAFTENEVLGSGNPWYCPSCQCHQIAEKRLRVCRWPSTLIVYIKRFLYHGKTAVKVDDEVFFPIEGFQPDDSCESKLYDLSSCVSHYGGVYSGHYTSYCKHPATCKWHLYNDENVTLHEPSTKDATGVYILFYQERITSALKK